MILTYPNADDGGRQIIPLLEAYAAKNADRVFAIPSLGQVRYLSAIKLASAVIGNSSSGGVIEVPSFDVPTVNIGVRQKGRLAAKSVIDAAANTDDIVKAINIAVRRDYLVDDEVVINPYGQGDSSSQLIDMIRTLQFESCKTFMILSE